MPSLDPGSCIAPTPSCMSGAGVQEMPTLATVPNGPIASLCRVRPDAVLYLEK